MNEETNVQTEGAENPPVGYCRVCGKALQEGEAQVSQGISYCSEHGPANASPPPPPQAPPADSPYSSPRKEGIDTSPPLAFILGWIPGVGAVYNQQYAKGVIHVIVFGLLVAITDAPGSDSLEALFGMMIALWFFYMAFEAFFTAKKRQLGMPVDEFSSILPLKNQAGSKAGPIVLIASGVLFLLITMDVVAIYQIVRFWPLLLIALGAYLLYNRVSDDGRSQEISHE